MEKSIYDALVKEVTPVVDRVGSGDAFMTVDLWLVQISK
jgi:hypothetical protein